MPRGVPNPKPTEPEVVDTEETVEDGPTKEYVKSQASASVEEVERLEGLIGQLVGHVNSLHDRVSDLESLSAMKFVANPDPVHESAPGLVSGGGQEVPWYQG